MKPGHIAPKTVPQLDKLHAYVISMAPFNPSTREMAAHMQCSHTQIIRYLGHLERQNRIVKDAKGRVAPEKYTSSALITPELIRNWNKYKEIIEKMNLEATIIPLNEETANLFKFGE